MNLFEKIFGTYSSREVKRIIPIINKIDSLDSTIAALSDDELRKKTFEFKDRVKNGETLDDILVEAFAVVREASYRVLNMKHYREQLIGGVVLHQGRISEMKTGEGKTLVATLPAYLNALSGNGVHVITVNDYLAERDANEMGKLYEFLGLTTGVITHDLSTEDRRNAYACDITYGTNNEFGFDYLRDNMVLYKNDKVQRDLAFCIIDEVDSILIDEARTPLIISGSGDKSTELYSVADLFVKTLKFEEDFTIDEKAKAVLMTDSGIAKAEKMFGLENYADPDNLSIQHHISQALKANHIMKKDIDYMVKENEILIVDEFTGRLMEGRRYSDGLHQAIEAKENVEIQRESKTLATITFQNYFRMYKKLSGMTGTAQTEENEFREIYGLDVVVIPTHKPIARIDHTDVIYKNQRGKYNAIIEDIIETNKKGQPVLVGTTSIEKSELLSKLLKERGIEHNVLNAKFHEQEAEIISHAGEYGRITIATNMAGRGTDIKLGEGALEAGGLKIIGTERHESRRIDNQLRGRSGRQGDVGESRFYISLEDDLMRLFGSERLSDITDRLGLQEDEAIENKMVTKALESAQKRVEGNNFDIRKRVLSYDDVMNQQRTIIYSQRNEVLEGNDIKEHILNMVSSIVNNSVHVHLDGDDVLDEEFKESLNSLIAYLETIFFHNNELKIEDIELLSIEEIIDFIHKKAIEVYESKEAEITEEYLRELERVVLLRCVDSKWMEHIDNMDHLKQGIGLRAYKQEDPIYAFQKEGSEMFSEMIYNIQLDTLKVLYNMSVPSISEETKETNEEEHVSEDEHVSE